MSDAAETITPVPAKRSILIKPHPVFKWPCYQNHPKIKNAKNLKTTDNINYKVIKFIGEGTFGTVFEVESKKKRYAMKVIKTGFEGGPQMFEREVSIMKTIADFGHENVISFIRSHDLVDPPAPCSTMAIVTELLGPSLYDIAKSALKDGSGNKSVFPITAIRNIGKQILNAMSHLESLQIYYLDLKPENVFFVTEGFIAEEYVTRSFQKKILNLVMIRKDDLRIRLGDFGSSTQHLQEAHTILGTVQMQNYRAPEVFLGIPYTTKSDVWSLGCVLCELYTGEPLFYGSNSFDTESVQFEMIQRVIGQAPSYRMWSEAFDADSTKIKRTKYGFKLELNAKFPNTVEPLHFNIRLGDTSATILFDLLQKVLIIDPILRPSFADIADNKFFSIIETVV